MAILEQNQQSQRAERERLLQENRRLNKQVSAYARQVWQMQTKASVHEE